MEALRNAFQARLELKVSNQEAVETATQNKAKLGVNPPAPGPKG